jgi:hypothetical protein
MAAWKLHDALLSSDDYQAASSFAPGLAKNACEVSGFGYACIMLIEDMDISSQ